jgi:hypothetical protein
MKLVKLSQMCSNEIYIKGCMGIYLCIMYKLSHLVFIMQSDKIKLPISDRRAAIKAGESK